MSEQPDDDLVRRLYRTTPASFVAARNAAVKELTRNGQKVAAATIATLRRPRVAEYALNALAATRPDVVATWATSVADAEAQQAAVIGGGDPKRLTALLAEVRAAAAELIDAAVALLGDGGSAQRTEITETLRRATSAAGAARVAAGLMGAPFEPSDEFFPGTSGIDVPPPTARPAKVRPAKLRPAGPATRPASPERAQQETAAARRAAEREAAARRRALERAEAAVSTAAARVRRAEQALTEARAHHAAVSAALEALRSTR